MRAVWCHVISDCHFVLSNGLLIATILHKLCFYPFKLNKNLNTNTSIEAKLIRFDAAASFRSFVCHVVINFYLTLTILHCWLPLESLERCWSLCWNFLLRLRLWWWSLTRLMLTMSQVRVLGRAIPSPSCWLPTNTCCPAGCCWSALSAAKTKLCARCSQVCVQRSWPVL